MIVVRCDRCENIVPEPHIVISQSAEDIDVEVPDGWAIRTVRNSSVNVLGGNLAKQVLLCQTCDTALARFATEPPEKAT